MSRAQGRSAAAHPGLAVLARRINEAEALAGQLAVAVANAHGSVVGRRYDEAETVLRRALLAARSYRPSR